MSPHVGETWELKHHPAVIPNVVLLVLESDNDVTRVLILHVNAVGQHRDLAAGSVDLFSTSYLAKDFVRVGSLLSKTV